MALTIPTALAAACRRTPERAEWLAALPDRVAELRRRWSLSFEGAFDGSGASCAFVAAVGLADGTPAVLKLGMPHMEGDHEIEGLRFWNGNPTVRLLDADDRRGAMLLERCLPGTSLRALPEAEQDVVIAGLLRQLWQPPETPHRFRPLSVMLAHWTAETLSQSARWEDPALVRDGLRLFGELSRSGDQQVVLATDLHAGNVLRAGREPWLVIDPKPFVGDPAYDATQHLLNCEARLRADPAGLIGRCARLLSIDQERLRLWLYARLAAEPRDDWNDAPGIELARALAP
jgi:streptomycin 6-kinase